jgi:hypothetical protein
MIGRLDRWWFCLLIRGHRWIVRRLNAHCRRESLRCFRRQLACQNPHLN